MPPATPQIGRNWKITGKTGVFVKAKNDKEKKGVVFNTSRAVRIGKVTDKLAQPHY